MLNKSTKWTTIAERKTKPEKTHTHRKSAKEKPLQEDCEWLWNVNEKKIFKSKIRHENARWSLKRAMKYKTFTFNNSLSLLYVVVPSRSITVIVIVCDYNSVVYWNTKMTWQTCHISLSFAVIDATHKHRIVCEQVYRV